jgi:hypothetical protein
MLSTGDLVMAAYGTFLVWGGVTAIRVLGGLVIAPRPAAYVWLRRTAIWSVGAAAITIGLSLAVQGLSQGA